MGSSFARSLFVCRGFHQHFAKRLCRARPKRNQYRIVAIVLHDEQAKRRKGIDRDHEKIPGPFRRYGKAPIGFGGDAWRSAVGQGLIHRSRRISGTRNDYFSPGDRRARLRIHDDTRSARAGGEAKGKASSEKQQSYEQGGYAHKRAGHVTPCTPNFATIYLNGTRGVTRPTSYATKCLGDHTSKHCELR